MNRIFVCSVVLFFSASFSFADTPTQVITLKDGSQIKGQVTKVENGIYTVKTPIIGDIHVSADDISNIAGNPTAGPLPAAKPASGLDQQIATQQKQIMANPQAMSDIQQLTQDQKIMKTLTDPTLVQAVSTHDYQAIQNNPKMQELMNNPKIQALIQKIASREQQQNTSS